MTFQGFPRGGPYTPVPDRFITELLAGVTSLAELKVTLHLLRALARRRGYPRAISRREVLQDPWLQRLVGNSTGTASFRQAVEDALRLAVARGTFLMTQVAVGESQQIYYLLNTPSDQRAAERLAQGELTAPPVSRPPDPLPPQEEIVRLYEDNVGLITPMVADELREASATYPIEWVRDAFREATALNHRSWRYIARILQRWAEEGRDDGETERDPGPERRERDKFVRGPYGHLVQR